VFLFFIICSITILWTSGLKYNSETHTFEYTSLISLEDHLKDVVVTVNGEKVGTETPLAVRDLKPGYYDVDICREGFYEYQRRFQLSTNDVGVIEGVVLIAKVPSVTIVDSAQAPKYVAIPDIDTGLTVTDGELYDYQRLITRFGTVPTQVHRYNSGYIYQTGKEVRLFLPNNNLDALVYTLQESKPAEMLLRPGSWIVYFYEGTQVRQVELTKTSVASVANQ
jgi:hypothetical protein